MHRWLVLLLVVSSLACTRPTCLEEGNANGAACPIDIDFDGGFPDAPPPCDPVAQTRCMITEACTWIVDQDNPPIGHFGCAPVGDRSLGESCTQNPAGPMGYSNCVAGAHCSNGVCRSYCDLTMPACGSNESCASIDSGVTIGACEP